MLPRGTSGWTGPVPAAGDDRLVAGRLAADVSGYMDREAWSAIAGAPGYEVSSWGRVRQGDREVVAWSNRRGDLVVCLEVGGRRRVRLLARLVRPTCRFGHPRQQRYRNPDGVERVRCARCRRVRYRRKRAAVAGVRSLLELLS